MRTVVVLRAPAIRAQWYKFCGGHSAGGATPGPMSRTVLDPSEGLEVGLGRFESGAAGFYIRLQVGHTGVLTRTTVRTRPVFPTQTFTCLTLHHQPFSKCRTEEYTSTTPKRSVRRVTRHTRGHKMKKEKKK